MYNVIKNVIENKLYELTDMLRKIDVFWLQGNVSDAERDELIQLARANADLTKTIDLYKAVEDLDTRVRVLEENKAPVPDKEEWPLYIPGKMYHDGDKITFMDKHYICRSERGCLLAPLIKPDLWEEMQ